MRTLTSNRRLALIPLLALLLVTGLPQTAQACSCAIGDPRDALHRSDGAFVGTYIGRTEVDDQTALYSFEVETAVKGTIGAEIDVRSSSNGASCGLEVGIGQRIGLLMDIADDGAWTSALCSQMDPKVLLKAAEPLPAPDGVGPVRYVVGGNLGREPPDGARPQGPDARLRRRRRPRAGRRCLHGRRAGGRGGRRGPRSPDRRPRSAFARHRADDHARRDPPAMDPACGVPARQRRARAGLRAPQGRVLAPLDQRRRRRGRVARPRARRPDPGRQGVRDRGA